MNILGVGFAPAEHRLDNAALRGLPSGGASVAGCGIQARSASIVRSDLLVGDDRSPKSFFDVRALQPTTLAVAAMRRAVESAGVALSSLGLMIAEGLTPIETTPGESQRVCSALELKINAYDVATSGTPLSSYCNLLMSWQDSRIPDYVAVASASLPTQRIRYDSGIAGHYFGDGAGAAILSTRAEGRFRVLRSMCGRIPGYDAQQFSIDAFDPLTFSESFLRDVVRTVTMSCLQHAKATWGLNLASVTLVAPQFHHQLLLDSAREFGIADERCINRAHDVGYTLGAASFAALVEPGMALSRGSQLLVVEAGVGREFGMVLLEVTR